MFLNTGLMCSHAKMNVVENFFNRNAEQLCLNWKVNKFLSSLNVKKKIKQNNTQTCARQSYYDGEKKIIFSLTFQDMHRKR